MAPGMTGNRDHLDAVRAEFKLAKVADIDRGPDPVGTQRRRAGDAAFGQFNYPASRQI
jgi:hypothetical protein